MELGLVLKLLAGHPMHFLLHLLTSCIIKRVQAPL